MQPDEYGRIARRLEPLHAVVYFAPEVGQAFASLGVRSARMGYLAGRAAPLGAVAPAVVAATFYSFKPGLVARYIPEAWGIASPADLIAARFDGVDRVLRRLLGEELISAPETAEAAVLARRAAEVVTTDGRPLAAAHLGTAWPTAPHLVLWHALSVLREHRGDGHVATLVDSGLTGLEALITETASGTGFVPSFARRSRGWSAAEWDAAVSRLQARGLLTPGTGDRLSAPGGLLRERLEAATHRLAVQPWQQLGSSGAVRLGRIGDRLVDRLLAADAFPARGVFTGGPGVDALTRVT